MDGKEINWRGSSLKDLSAMPQKVRKTFGFALRLAQNGLEEVDGGQKPAKARQRNDRNAPSRSASD